MIAPTSAPPGCLPWIQWQGQPRGLRSTATFLLGTRRGRTTSRGSGSLVTSGNGSRRTSAATTVWLSERPTASVAERSRRKRASACPGGPPLGDTLVWFVGGLWPRARGSGGGKTVCGRCFAARRGCARRRCRAGRPTALRPPRRARRRRRGRRTVGPRCSDGADRRSGSTASRASGDALPRARQRCHGLAPGPCRLAASHRAPASATCRLVASREADRPSGGAHRRGSDVPAAHSPSGCLSHTWAGPSGGRRPTGSWPRRRLCVAGVTCFAQSEARPAESACEVARALCKTRRLARGHGHPAPPPGYGVLQWPALCAGRPTRRWPLRGRRCDRSRAVRA